MGLKVKCKVPNCINESSQATKRAGITFHPFPTNKDTIKAWQKSLGLTSYNTFEDNVICSEHFHERDFFITKYGTKKIHRDAVPFIVDPEAPAASKVCRICLVMDKKMKNLKKYYKLFEDVTGIPADEEDSRLPQSICWECAARLSSAANFRAKALLSDTMLHDALSNQPHLKFSHINPIKKTINEYGFKSRLKQVTFDIEHFDMNIRDTFVDSKPVVMTQDPTDNDLHEIIDENEDENDKSVNKNEIKHDDNDLDENTDTNNITEDTDMIEFEIKNTENDENFTEDTDMIEYKDVITENDIKNENSKANIGETLQTGDDYDEDIIIKCDRDDNDNADCKKEVIQFKNDDSNDAEDSTDEEIYYAPKKVKRKNIIVVNRKNARNIIKVPENDFDDETNNHGFDLYAIKKGDITIMNIRKISEIPEEFSELKAHYTISILSQDQVMQEILERKEKPWYLNALYKCTVCYQAFADEEKHDAHMDTHDRKNGPFQCGICMIFRRRAGSLRSHMKMHAFEFTCKKCGLVTRHKPVAKGHISFHEGSTHTCPHCPRTFNCRTTYHNHIRIKHMSDHVCELCGCTFANPLGVKLHKNRTHRHILNNLPPFKGPHCDTCGVTFLSQDAYDTHLRCSSKHYESGTNPVPVRIPYRRVLTVPQQIKCEQCKVICESVKEYKQHFLQFHPSVTPTKYRAAKIKFPRKAKKYVCDVCGKKFVARHYLKTHQWVHTGVKMFQCHICGKSFSQRISLSLHIQVAHTEEKPSWDCKFCGKSFSVKANREKHVKRCHMDEKPFNCEFCGRTFCYQSELASHTDFVHKKKPYPVRQKKKPTAEELE